MTNLGAGGQGASQRDIAGDKAPTLKVEGKTTRLRRWETGRGDRLRQR